jgi:hypothetical protein
MDDEDMTPTEEHEEEDNRNMTTRTTGTPWGHNNERLHRDTTMRGMEHEGHGHESQGWGHNDGDTDMMMMMTGMEQCMGDDG